MDPREEKAGAIMILSCRCRSNSVGNCGLSHFLRCFVGKSV